MTTKKPKKVIPTEAQEQAALFQWANIMENKHPELALMYHIPNGGLRNKAVAVRLTAQGVRSGVPDICLPVARGGYHGLYIELKRKEGGRAAENQEKWLRLLLEKGYFATVCKGADEAINLITKYLAEVSK